MYYIDCSGYHCNHFHPALRQPAGCSYTPRVDSRVVGVYSLVACSSGLSSVRHSRIPPDRLLPGHASPLAVSLPSRAFKPIKQYPQLALSHTPHDGSHGGPTSFPQVLSQLQNGKTYSMPRPTRLHPSVPAPDLTSALALSHPYLPLPLPRPRPRSLSLLYGQVVYERSCHVIDERCRMECPLQGHDGRGSPGRGVRWHREILAHGGYNAALCNGDCCVGARRRRSILVSVAVAGACSVRVPRGAISDVQRACLLVARPACVYVKSYSCLYRLAVWNRDPLRPSYIFSESCHTVHTKLYCPAHLTDL